MDSNQITQVLQNAQNPDQNIRQQAEQWLASAENLHFVPFVNLLAQELASGNKDPLVRKMAGIVFKNCLQSSHDETHNEQLAKRWLSIDLNARNTIKSLVVQVLSDPVEHARHTAAQVVAAIAIVELPSNEWPQLIPGLLGQMNSNDFVKHATLECLGYIAEGIDPQVLEGSSNDILTAVCRGIRDPNVEVKLAACGALYNSLEFCRVNFSKENERSHIMQVVCEAAISKEPRIKAASLECLVQIATLYYDYLSNYMQNIFNISLEAIQKGPDEVSLQGVEFWSTLCDEEIYLAEEFQEAQNDGRSPDRVSQHFIRGALKYLVPLLLEALTKQEDEREDDDWNVATAAGACLVLVAQTVEDEVIPFVVPFVTSNTSNPNWKFREAAILAFGSILEGPKNLGQLILQQTPVLLERMKDENVYVKDTTAWTLGKICQLHAPYLGQYMNPVVTAMGQGLDDSPRVASNCCWGLHNIALAFEEESSNPTSHLSSFFLPCLQKLVQVAQRDDSDQNNLRTSAYEAMNALISSSARDTIPTIVASIPAFLSALDNSFKIEDPEEQTDLQTLLCGVLQTITNKLEEQMKQFSNPLMQLYLRVFSSKSTTVHEEALMAVGALANAIGTDFDQYMLAFKPYLLLALRNYQEASVCSIAVGVIGDISRSLGPKLLNYSDDIITELLTGLQNQYLNRDVKPDILSCFGDIGLGIGGGFEKYLQVVMNMLQQASQTQVNANDLDLVDYLNNLREGIFDAFTGIIQGLRSDNKVKPLLEYTNFIFGFVDYVAQDKQRTDAVTRVAIGVVGDLAATLGGEIKNSIRLAPHLEALINDGQRSDDPATIEIAKWTKETVTKILSGH